MKPTYLIFYFLGLLGASFFLYQVGRSQVIASNASELSPRDLMKEMGNSQLKLQIVDVRPNLVDFALAHVPGALPFPECDPEKTPKEAMDRIFSYVSTVIVSESGNGELFQKCLSYFTRARNIGGGFAAWQEALLPEDEGEYSPPRLRGGGGCL